MGHPSTKGAFSGFLDNSPMLLLTPAETRAIEAACAAHPHGHSYAEMIEDAGSAAAREILARCPTHTRALVLVGGGNNGADGLVCAQVLLRAGWGVSMALLRERPPADPWLARATANGLTPLPLPALREAAADAIVIDAVLGSGLARPLGPELVRALDAVRRAATIIALDGPTGMNHATGALDPAALRAHLTLALGFFKRGHFCHPAAAACGERVLLRTRLSASIWV